MEVHVVDVNALVDDIKYSTTKIYNYEKLDDLDSIDAHKRRIVMTPSLEDNIHEPDTT
jgi:hypothetical protein